MLVMLADSQTHTEILPFSEARSLGISLVPNRRFRLTEPLRGTSRRMIRSFACVDIEALYHSRLVTRFRNIERVARRKLLQIHAVTELASLRIPPGNQLEALMADRKDQHSLRINDQWRICFVWKSDGAHRVEIVGYHQEFEPCPDC